VIFNEGNNYSLHSDRLTTREEEEKNSNYRRIRGYDVRETLWRYKWEGSWTWSWIT